MDRTKIKSELTNKYIEFTAYITSLSENDFLKKQNNKWSAGQQLEHIFLSIRPVNLALTIPKFLLTFFGRSSASRSYDELVQSYQNVLKNGGKASSMYLPKSVSTTKKQKLITKLENIIKRLSAKIDNYNEDDLDKYNLPHPLLGKITIREMLYFCIYHVQHHQQLTEENLMTWS
jgi:hypothetical protein